MSFNELILRVLNFEGMIHISSYILNMMLILLTFQKDCSFICFWLCVLGLCCCMVFLQLRQAWLFSSCNVQASHCDGSSCCGGRMAFRARGCQQFQLPGCRAQAQYLWGMGLVALRHVRSSWIRDQTCVSWIGRQILYHWCHQGSPYFVDF